MASNLPNGARPRARSWSDRGDTRPGLSRRKRLFVVALVLLALAAVLAALVLLPRTLGDPFLLSIPVTEYLDRQLPINAFARADSEALSHVFPGSHKLANSQERHLLEKDLESLKSTSSETVLVHLSALARADERGVYLLPGDAEVDDPARWLQLERVLRALRDCPARHKLLLLDLQRGSLGPRLGLLADQLSEPLFQALEQAVMDDPKLWVLCPCSTGQVSLTSDDLGQSVFGYYLVQGLEGRADGYNPKYGPDRRVSLDELSRFLAVHVDRWARQNRGIAQSPRLFARDPERATELFLSTVRATATPAEETSAPSASYPGWLLEGWKLRDGWTDEVLPVAPGSFARLEATLLRAEHLWRGRNVTEADAQKEWTDGKAAGEKQAAEARRAVSRPDRPHSLALALGLGEKPPEPKEIDALRTLAGDALRAAKAKDPAPREAFQARLEAARKPYAERPIALAWVGFEAATDDLDLDPARLRFYTTDWLPPTERSGNFAETHTLARLVAVAPDPRMHWPKDAIHLTLRVARLAEQVAACQAGGRCVPQALPWIRPALAELDDRRRQAEELLRGPAAKWPEAVRLLERVSDEYATLRDLVEAVAAAEQTRDEALAALPAHAAWQMMRFRPDDRDDTAWFRAVDATTSLADFLVTGPTRSSGENAERTQEVLRQTRAVRGPLNELQQRVLREQVDVPAGRQSPLRLFEADLLLQTAVLSAPKRAVLWKNTRELAATLHQQTQGLDRQDFELERRPTPGSAWDTAPTTASTDYPRRVRYLLGLLKLGGKSDLNDLEKLAREAQEPAGPYGLASRLRMAATIAVEKQLQEYLVKRRYREADRLQRTIHPFERQVLQPLANLGVRPAVELRRTEARALWQALADRCRAEARWLGAHSQADFYSRAAEDYLHYAR